MSRMIGDLLASEDLAATVLALVMQQYVGAGPYDERIGTLNTTREGVDDTGAGEVEERVDGAS
ncbi:hypothetical protein U1Q18_018728 [Sarracenia purpurea var. burkii]